MNVLRKCFERRPQQSVRSRGRNLGQPKLTVWKVLLKKTVFEAIPMPQTLHELRGRIRVAVATIDQPMLARVGAELQQRLDCFVVNGQYIEHL